MSALGREGFHSPKYLGHEMPNRASFMAGRMATSMYLVSSVSISCCGWTRMHASLIACFSRAKCCAGSVWLKVEFFAQLEGGSGCMPFKETGTIYSYLILVRAGAGDVDAGAEGEGGRARQPEQPQRHTRHPCAGVMPAHGTALEQAVPAGLAWVHGQPCQLARM